MNITLELNGTWDEIVEEMRRHVSTPAATEVLDGMSLQDVLAYTGKRAEEEGYDFEVIKPGDRTLSAAEQRKEEARAKLRGDLEASLKAEPKPEETKPEPEETKTAPKKKNGAKAETPEQRKERCLERLMDLYTDPTMVPVVRKLLAEHGNGAKNFRVVPDENFAAISDALAALEN
jgi:hypothetical protein